MTPTRPPLELAPDAAALPMEMPGQHGIRLEQFQLLNWGTFDGAVQRLVLDGSNALLTGQVGAGKSTLVDGLTTLFAAPSRIVFNRAAGAERSERTPTSYVLGHYRNVFDESTGNGRPEALRTAKTAYSVLLSRFTGLPSGGSLSAGVIFYFEASGQLHKLYFTAPKPLDIAEHLTGHADARAVRAALRALGAEAFDDNFKGYQRSLTRALNISSAALDLLIQTVSMKSVGNLTAFVRAHMLDSVDAAPRIAAILEHWVDLTRAYELVVTAREQLEKLEPVATLTELYNRADARIAAAQQARLAVPALVERQRVAALQTAIAEVERTLPTLTAKVNELDGRLRAERGRNTTLTLAVEREGGTDLVLAEAAVNEATAALQRVRAAYDELSLLAGRAGVTPPEVAADWPRFLAAVQEAAEQAKTAAAELQRGEHEALTALGKAREEVTALQRELAEAERRNSNVPYEQASLRGHIAAGVGLRPEDVPFAAELLAVSETSAQWEAAAERLVRPLALSLLVAEEHYAHVAAWIDGNHLGRRVVYYRVPAAVSPGDAAPRPGTMAAHLQVRGGSVFTSWLRAEVNRRYDHVCVLTAPDLAKYARAVTRAGQVKDNARHEKDDRNRATDRRHYVLGWDTAARRAALQDALPGARSAVTAAEQAADKATAKREGHGRRVSDLGEIARRFTDPTAVDVSAAHDRVTEAESHRDRLAVKPSLAALREQLADSERKLEALDSELGQHQQKLGGAKSALAAHRTALTAAEASLQETPAPELLPDAAAALAEAVAAAGAAPASPAQCDLWGRRVSDALVETETSAGSTRSRNGQRLVAAVKDFAALWPAVVAELGTEVEARGEYLALRERLRTDDLPSYEADFRDQLQTNAIHELVTFSHFLDTESRKIGSRIDTINSALVDIDYRPGTYIRLEHENAPDPDVREFRAQLRDVTSNTLLADDEAYAEQRFLAVKALLDRFAGREGTTNADQAWTKRVTDVRNWHTFAASERTRDEDVAVEHYTDSGGKSGGQKEKLAYTILAASLSYQYGLAGGHTDAFRFVMIDEAFGRGSDESTRFGLELFRRLGLQLLVVTPLQKIHTIDPFVNAVGYVRSENDRSRLVTMTITEYRASRAQHVEQRRAGGAPAPIEALLVDAASTSADLSLIEDTGPEAEAAAGGVW
jgi:uncharacterized protein YPO0396